MGDEEVLCHTSMGTQDSYGLFNTSRIYLSATYVVIKNKDEFLKRTFQNVTEFTPIIKRLIKS